VKRKISGQFVPHRADMLLSSAWAELSLSARRVLDRLEIEYCRSGGMKNGQLVCTHQNFREFGIHDHAVAPGIREAEALGFLAIHRGRAGNGTYRTPSVYRLTYLPIPDAEPSDEWRAIESAEQARAMAKKAREDAPPAPRKSQRQWRKPPSAPMAETATTVVAETAIGATNGGNRHYYLEDSTREEPPLAGAEVVPLPVRGPARG
jgi:hypothetical protein